MGPAFIPELQVLAPHRSEFPRDLLIAVIFTDVDGTRAALKAACHCSVGLDADIDLIVPHVVPYPLPLVRPSVPAGFRLRQLMDLASVAEIQPSIYVYLCRDAVETLLQVLQRHSLVVVGIRKRWFPTRPERMARALRNNGHEVLLARYR